MKKRILIADDEKAIRILLAMALKTYDYEVDIVENGLEAINNIHKRYYDLIITDYMMPEMDGLELTKRIRSEYPSIPILIISANGSVHDLLKSGATACISKPFNILEIQNKIKTMLNRNSERIPRSLLRG
ncbi:MAG: response regulator [Desulfobacterales bacterium]|nr:response regulator [Desulfobacterales bacterium]